MLKKEAFPTAASSEWVASFFWTLLLGCLLLTAGFVGNLVSNSLPTASAAPKPHATTFQVTDCSSSSDSNASTPNTLAYALANYVSGDTIAFVCNGGASAAYTITVPSTITVTQNLTLDSSGYNVTLDGGNSVRILDVITGTNFTLDHLTIANGNASGFGDGGGIYNNGTLTVTNVTFVSNSATNGGAILNSSSGTINSLFSSTFVSNTAYNFNNNSGGAIFNDGTINSLANSTFISNSAVYNGGAVNNQGTINNLSNSTFVSNTAAYGGAIHNEGSISTITNLSNSTFNSNAASDRGGAIDNVQGTINSLSNSTFVSNSALNVSGAVSNYATIISLTNSTFVSNSVFNVASNGGAIGNKGTIHSISNSIFVKGASGNNCNKFISDDGGNLSDDASCSFYQLTSRNNVTNLNLGTLGYYNNGTTQTLPLLAGSTALFAGVPANCLTTDQNNQPRPQPTGTNCDSGAFEANLQLSNVISSASNSPNPSNVGQVVTFTATIAADGIVTPTGNLVFTNTTTNTPLGSAIINSNGGAVFTTTFASAGNFSVTVSYSGNLTFTSVITTLSQTVNPLTSTVALTNSPNPSVNGQSVTLTATVSPTAATGIVTFTDTTANAILGTATLSNGVAITTISNLSVGSHTIVATYSGDNAFTSGSSNVVTQQVNPAPVTTTTYTYYLPFVANNASNFTTYLAFQNIGGASANITVTYYDNNGNNLAASTLITQVAQYAETIPANPFASGRQGAGVITSDQPLNVIVPEATPYGGSAYAVSSGSSNSLIAPFALNQAFGDFTTQLNIFNGGSSLVTATVTFYGTVGNSSTITSSSTSVSIAAHTTANLNQNSLPTGFSGWAQITGSANTLVAQVLEQSPSTKFVAIANAIANPSTTQYAPAVFNGGYGSFYTGANIINPNANAVTVTVSYYDLSATMTATTPFAIPAFGVASIFNGATSGNGLPSGGLPKGFIGSVAVSSTGGLIAMSVNENGGVTSAGNSRSGTYAAISSGGSTVGLPVISNGGFTYVTGDTILNTSSQTVTGTITYYNTNGTAAGVSKTFTIAGHGSQAYYQGDGSLPANFYGTAVVTETGGPANSLIVTTNAQNIALFYTYSEPNS